MTIKCIRNNTSTGFDKYHIVAIKTISYFYIRMKRIPVLLFSLIAILMTLDAGAQCAMCKANVESNLKEGGSIGSALNPAIIYLMMAPYILLMLGAYFFYRKQINKKIASIVVSLRTK